ncbi:hypothetical protein H4582DRAFT_1969598 [Lactarius indigo]|nr:hypothetical protein H4582DRAFT_1969598 [Lactarius indigo]
MENISPKKANVLTVLPSTIKDSRYKGTAHVHASPTITIGPSGTNLLPATSYQSQQWTISAHPEGKRYAHSRSNAGITIVTEADVSEPGVSDQLNAWLAVICDMAIEKRVRIPETSHIFLELHQDSGTCNYYFADHGLRTVFWLHTFNNIGVGLPSSNSRSYLQYSLEENYWIHVGLFPGTASQYAAKALNEIQVVFLHAHKDAPTSETLTFPYTFEECREFVDLLERSKDRVSSPHVTIYVATLWATVANHRSFIHSDEEPEHYQSSSSPSTLGVCEVLLFGFPDRYEARFKSFWIDQPVDSRQLFLCVFDLAVTSFLLQRQQRLLNMNIPTSVAYLKHWNTSYGCQPIAMVHSLPQALFVWALLLFSMQGFWMIFSDLPLVLLLCTLFPAAAILIMMCLGIWLVVRPRPEPIEDAVLPPAIHPPLESRSITGRAPGSMV